MFCKTQRIRGIVVANFGDFLLKINIESIILFL